MQESSPDDGAVRKSDGRAGTETKPATPLAGDNLVRSVERSLRPVVFRTSALASISLALRLGFSIPDWMDASLNVLNIVLAAVFCWTGVLVVLRCKGRRKMVLRRHAVEFGMAGVFAALFGIIHLLGEESLGRLLGFFHIPTGTALSLDLVRLFLLGNVLVQLLRSQQRLITRHIRPELILAGSFAALILAGTLLLLLPRAGDNPGRPISFVDALFTSTSAACVTGLSVRDTGVDFSTLGQVIILGIFQVGGLGIMTFVAFVSVLSSESLPVPQLVAFKQMVNAQTLGGLKRQILAMIAATVLIEALGAGCLYLCLPEETDPLLRLHWSVFHSVSAFCNAGFSLQSDSLVGLQSSAGINCTIMGLIVLGGLGFLVIPDVLRFEITKMPWLRRLPFFRRWHMGARAHRMSVQTKLSLVVTVVLLLIGFAGFWVLEAGHSLVGHNAHDSFLISAFQSVTARTAGFNTVDIGKLQDSTLILIMALMVIGSCPVSTGGGIKTVTLGVLVLALRAMFTGKERVEAFGRTLPQQVLFASLTVFVLYALASTTALFLLTVFDPKMSMQAQAFEVISALSTVGLSTGITADLSTASKLVLCVTMFVGRVGPIALVLSVFQSRSQVSYEYPEENIVVG